SARQTTGTLVLRGALLQTIGIPSAKSVMSATSTDKGESLCVKTTSQPTEEHMKRVFDCANRAVEDEAEVVVIDVPLPIKLKSGSEWAESVYACEYAKFKGKETDKVVRIAY